MDLSDSKDFIEVNAYDIGIYSQKEWENREIEHRAELRVLRDEDERLKKVFDDYMKIVRKIACNIWDAKTSASLLESLRSVEIEIEKALKGD